MMNLCTVKGFRSNERRTTGLIKLRLKKDKNQDHYMRSPGSRTYYAFSFLASEAKTVIADEPLYKELEKETASFRFWVAP